MGESESEEWLGAVPSSLTTVNSVLDSIWGTFPIGSEQGIEPAPNAREIAMPGSIVIDATGSTQAPSTVTIPTNMPFPSKERSRLPVNPYNGYVNIIPGSRRFGAPDHKFQFSDLFRHGASPLPLLVGGAAGLERHYDRQQRCPAAVGGGRRLLSADRTAGRYPSRAIPRTLKGEYSVVTLFTRTGQVITNFNPQFLNSAGGYHPANPFIPAEQGSNSGP